MEGDVWEIFVCAYIQSVSRILRLCNVVRSCMSFIFIHQRLYGCRVEYYWIGYKLLLRFLFALVGA